MKLISFVFLLSFVSSNVHYKCAKKDGPHFYSGYRKDSPYIGHIRIERNKFRILKQPRDETKHRNLCAKALDAINNLEQSGELFYTSPV